MSLEGLRRSENESNDGIMGDVFDALGSQTRRGLVADIAGHPRGLPSMIELTFLNDLSRRTVREHLNVLRNAGIVEEVTFSEEYSPARDAPRKFYGITDEAREFFDVNGLFQPEHWRDVQSRVEKPEEVRAAEEAPRPGDI